MEWEWLPDSEVSGWLSIELLFSYVESLWEPLIQSSPQPWEGRWSVSPGVSPIFSRLTTTGKRPWKRHGGWKSRSARCSAHVPTILHDGGAEPGTYVYTQLHHDIPYHQKNVLTDTTLHTGTQCANYPQSLMERVLLFFTHGNATYRAGCHHHNNNSSHHNDS